jgi:hypothetical protein
MAGRELTNLTDDFKAIAETWAKHGIELRMLADQRFYLTKSFVEMTFVIRHSSDTRRLPHPSDSFRVWIHDRVTCQLSQDVQSAVGIEQLEREICSWRQRLKPSTTPVQQERSPMSPWGFASGPLMNHQVVHNAI